MPSSAFSFLNTINIQQTTQIAATMIVVLELSHNATALVAKMHDIAPDRHYFARDCFFMVCMLMAMDIMRRLWLASFIAFKECESNDGTMIISSSSIYTLRPKEAAPKVAAPGSEGEKLGTKEEETKPEETTNASDAQEIKSIKSEEIKSEGDGASTPPPNKKSVTPPPAMESNGPKEE